MTPASSYYSKMALGVLGEPVRGDYPSRESRPFINSYSNEPQGMFLLNGYAPLYVLQGYTPTYHYVQILPAQSHPIAPHAPLESDPILPAGNMEKSSSGENKFESTNSQRGSGAGSVRRVENRQPPRSLQNDHSETDQASIGDNEAFKGNRLPLGNSKDGDYQERPEKPIKSEKSLTETTESNQPDSGVTTSQPKDGDKSNLQRNDPNHDKPGMSEHDEPITGMNLPDGTTNRHVPGDTSEASVQLELSSGKEGNNKKTFAEIIQQNKKTVPQKSHLQNKGAPIPKKSEIGSVDSKAKMRNSGHPRKIIPSQTPKPDPDGFITVTRKNGIKSNLNHVVLKADPPKPILEIEKEVLPQQSLETIAKDETKDGVSSAHSPRKESGSKNTINNSNSLSSEEPTEQTSNMDDEADEDHVPMLEPTVAKSQAMVEPDVAETHPTVEPEVVRTQPAKSKGKKKKNKKGKKDGQLKLDELSKERASLPAIQHNENGGTESLFELHTDAASSVAEDCVSNIFDKLAWYYPRNQLSVEEKHLLNSGLKFLDNPEELRRIWNKEDIELWKGMKISVGLMRRILHHLKVKQNQDAHLALEPLGEVLARLIVTYHVGIFQSMEVTFKIMKRELGEYEAFRRISILASQLEQFLLLQHFQKKKTQIGGITNAEWVAYSMLCYDIYGTQISQIGNQVGKYDDLDSKEKSRILNLISSFCGQHAYQRRISPENHFDTDSKWIEIFNMSKYAYIFSSDNLRIALQTKGVSLNTISTIIFILGLENESWLELIDKSSAISMARVLHRLVTPSEANYLPWKETAERHWLTNYYQNKYFVKFHDFVAKLSHDLGLNLNQDTDFVKVETNSELEDADLKSIVEYLIKLEPTTPKDKQISS